MRVLKNDTKILLWRTAEPSLSATKNLTKSPYLILHLTLNFAILQIALHLTELPTLDLVHKKANWRTAGIQGLMHTGGHGGNKGIILGLNKTGYLNYLKNQIS